MSLFDAIQNLISGVTDSAQGSIGDIVGGVSEIPQLQEIQDQVSTVADGVTETTTSVTEQGQSVVDEITQNLGL